MWSNMVASRHMNKRRRINYQQWTSPTINHLIHFIQYNGFIYLYNIMDLSNTMGVGKSVYIFSFI
jgi:hypothetical protein